jgi:hypothetical protein
VRRNFPLREFAHTSPQLLLFFRKVEFHEVSVAVIGFGYIQPQFALYRILS